MPELFIPPHFGGEREAIEEGQQLRALLRQSRSLIQQIE